MKSIASRIKDIANEVAELTLRCAQLEMALSKLRQMATDGDAIQSRRVLMVLATVDADK